jgi:hypothetical protein
MLGYLNGWLNQQIIQEPFVAYNQNGDKTYGIPVMLACRTEVGIKKITNKEGQEVISTGTTYLDPSTPVGYNDRLTMPDGSQPRIMRLDDQPNGDGTPVYIAVYT